MPNVKKNTLKIYARGYSSVWNTIKLSKGRLLFYRITGLLLKAETKESNTFILFFLYVNIQLLITT